MQQRFLSQHNLPNAHLWLQGQRCAETVNYSCHFDALTQVRSKKTFLQQRWNSFLQLAPCTASLSEIKIETDDPLDWGFCVAKLWEERWSATSPFLSCLGLFLCIAQHLVCQSWDLLTIDSLWHRQGLQSSCCSMTTLCKLKGHWVLSHVQLQAMVLMEVACRFANLLTKLS